MSRVMRSLVNTRRKLSPRILRRLISGYLTVPEAAQRKEDLLQFLTEVLVQFKCTFLLVSCCVNGLWYVTSKSKMYDLLA